MKKNTKPSKNKKSSKTQLQPSKNQQSLQKTGDLHPSVLISGYYGFENLGDELILKVLVDELKARQVKITVLSQNPQKTAADYGVKAIKRTSFIDVVDALASTNLFISGGGGLFQDVTGPMSAVYYGGLIHLARFFDVPVVFWAQGVGPLQRKFSQSMTASALKKCEKITVRDEKSAALVESLIGEKPEITADPVWLLKLSKPKPSKAKQDAKKSGKKAGHSSENAKMPWCVGLSLRPWPELTADKLEALADCLNALAEQRDGPVQFKLLPFQKKEDTELLAGFAKRLATNHRITVEMVEPMAVLEAVGTCNVLLGMRFHSLILGLLYGVPVYGLTYDPKVASLLSMFNLKGTSIATLKTISPDGLNAAFAQYPEIDLKPFREQSRKNMSVLEQLLKIPESKLVL